MGPAVLLYCGQCGAIYGVVPRGGGRPQSKLKIETSHGSSPEEQDIISLKKGINPTLPTDPQAKLLSPDEALSMFKPATKTKHGFYTRMADPGDDEDDEEDATQEDRSY